MSKPVLFVGFRPLDRSENLKAVYDAYNGEKRFVDKSLRPDMYQMMVRSKVYDLMVTDDFPDMTPGKCIVLWHAIHGCKKIGIDQPMQPYYTPDTPCMIDYIVSAGQEAVPLWKQATDVPMNRILSLGYAASDLYFNAKKGDGHTELASYRSYLYLPTFREKNEGYITGIDPQYVDLLLHDDELLVIKPHPWHFYQNHEDMKGFIDEFNTQYKHIKIVSPTEPTTPYLIDCDVTITDYSSVMIEGYLCDKPCVLYTDNDDYLKTRGMYLPYPDYYSPLLAQNEGELIAMCRDAFLSGTSNDVCAYLAGDCDGHARERICELIERVNNE